MLVTAHRPRFHRSRCTLDVTWQERRPSLRPVKCAYPIVLSCGECIKEWQATAARRHNAPAVSCRLSSVLPESHEHRADARYNLPTLGVTNRHGKVLACLQLGRYVSTMVMFVPGWPPPVSQTESAPDRWDWVRRWQRGLFESSGHLLPQ